MHTTIRELLPQLGKKQLLNELSMSNNRMINLMDKTINVCLSGQHYEGIWYYLIEHPEGFEGANDGLLYFLKDIKILVPQIEEGSFWQCLSEDIDEDGEFLGDADDYEPLIEELWWLESNLPLKLSEPNNLIYVKKLKKETLL